MLILMGMKHCGKSTTGKIIAGKKNIPFIDLDDIIEQVFSPDKQPDKKMTVREIYRKKGKAVFKSLEAEALSSLSSTIQKPGVLALGGGTIENREAMRLLKGNTTKIYLEIEESILWERIQKGGVPSFLNKKNPETHFHTLYIERTLLYRVAADIIVSLSTENPDQAAEIIINKIGEKP